MQKRTYWQYLYLLVLFPCLIYTLFYVVRAIKFDYTPVPLWDSWRSIQYLDQLLRFDVRHFWVQHNEHRIVFPEIVYALDYILFRGEQLLPFAFNIACQLVQLVLLWWLLMRLKDMPMVFRLTLGASCTLFLLSVMQVQGFLGTFELQWYMSNLAVVAALAFLTQAERTGRLSLLAASIGAAVVATYTTGNGMMVWPVLVGMSVLLRLPRTRISAVAIAGALSIAAYFIGYSFVSQGRAMLLLAHPLYALWFVCVFVGAPLSYINVQLGGLAGLTGLLLVAFGLFTAIRGRRPGDAVLVVTAGFCLYVACSALMIAYGRMDPNHPAVGEALAARYVSVPLSYCACLAILIGWLVIQLTRSRSFALHFNAAALTVMLLVTVMVRQNSYERAFKSEQAHAHESGLALIAGIDDPGLMRALYPDPQFPLTVVAGIREKRLSIFASGHQDWIGQPVNGVFVPAPPSLCSGAAERLSPVTGGYRVAGWAWDRAEDRPPKDVVLTNKTGVIVGFGETRHGGYPHNDPARRPPSNWDWVGYARTSGLSGTVQAYAVVHKGEMACSFGTPLPAPGLKLLAPSQVGAPIQIAEWKADPAWTRNGFHPSVGTLNGEILYGSFSGNDANQGVLASPPIDLAGHSCIALPIAHGPSVGGQSVRVVDPASGKLIQSLPLSDTPGIWQFWGIEVEGMDSLSIVAEDRGSQWGQWVAIGEPHWCRQ